MLTGQGDVPEISNNGTGDRVHDGGLYHWHYSVTRTTMGTGVSYRHLLRMRCSFQNFLKSVSCSGLPCKGDVKIEGGSR